MLVPVRKIPFINNLYYHLFNRGVEKRIIFLGKRDFKRFLDCTNFYNHQLTPCRYSFYLRLNSEAKIQAISSLEKSGKLVEILCYALMPNHFHFLVRQIVENGISTFIKNTTDSYSRYFNIKYERNGPLFQGQFKSILVESEEQLYHLSRYIHLNPYTSFLVKRKEEIINYEWMSYKEYLNQIEGFCCKSLIMSHFKTSDKYSEFVLDQADYQRSLDFIKHLSFKH